MSQIMPIVSSRDGARVTVNDFIKMPKLIPRRILEIARNQFIADAILRDAGGNNSGVAEFYQSTPLFSDLGATVRTEFGEYKITTTSEGIPQIATAVDRGLSVLISDEMRRRNRVDRVNTQITQVRNTMRRDWDASFMGLLLAAGSGVQTFAVSTAWATSSTIRQDILKAEKLVNNATTGQQANNFLQFEANTLIITETTKFDLLSSNPFSNIYTGNIADENLQYVGKLPRRILDLDTLVVRSGGALPDGTAVVLERKTVGFISDEVPLQSTPLYRLEENKSWRNDTNRTSIMGLDQPLAICVLTGV